MTYNPFLPAGPYNPFTGYVDQAVNPFKDPYAGSHDYSEGPPVAHIEEVDEDAIDPRRFNEVFLNGRFTPGKFASHVDLSFGNLDLDDAVDFFRYLASDDGQDELTRSLVSLFVRRGDITVLEAINILADD